MEKSLTSLDWSLIQSFLAVAETGSLSAAAHMLGASQPTLGRQIKQIEAQLNASLFQRNPRGFTLTLTGENLMPHARVMRDAINKIALTAAGQTQTLTGTVRIAASEFVSAYVLPKVIARLRQAFPEITIDLVASDASENLLFREADIALRMYRPTQLDVITKHIGDLSLGMFASVDYLNRKGRPKTAADILDGHDLVGYDQDEQIILGMRQMNMAAQRDWFATRCDNSTAYWELVRAGCGIGFSQTHIGMNDPDVEQILCDIPIPSLPIWLTAHEAMRQTPRIRRVWDALESGIKTFVS